jgi:hypothetical protein
MRRSRSNLVAALVACSLAAGAASPVGAQGEPDTDGALFLLLPVGARAIGMGQAVAAEQGGSESVWWNPSGLAKSARREAAIHHSETFIATGDAISVVVPSALIGVLSASVNILNFGEQEVTDETGTQGTLLPRNFVYAASYATTLGRRFRAGVTYKLIQLRFDCSGGCAGVPRSSALTSALDLGAQADVGGRLPFAFGIAVRNMGIPLQVLDTEQADRLPTRLQTGVALPVAVLASRRDTTVVRVAADLVTDLDFERPALRFGADIGWQRRVHLRAGYVFREAESAGPSLGLGLVAGSLVVDLARAFQGFSADAGKSPTYLSLRYLF